MKNIDEIRARLKNLQEGRPKSKRWKPKDEHQVRALPLPGEEDLALMVKIHYGVDDGKPMYCPSTDGQECAFCDYAAYLRSWKDENGEDKTEARRKKDWEAFKKVDAATKHYVPIVVRKKDDKGNISPTETEGPFLWEMTSKVYQQLLEICTNDERNEDHQDGGALRILTSLKHGVDLILKLEKANTPANNTSYDRIKVEPRMKTSEVIKGDPKATQALLERLPTVDDITKRVDSKQADVVFATYKDKMSGAGPEGSGDAGVEHSTNGAEKPAEGGADVDEVIKKLMSQLPADQQA